MLICPRIVSAAALHQLVTLIDQLTGHFGVCDIIRIAGAVDGLTSRLDRGTGLVG